MVVVDCSALVEVARESPNGLAIRSLLLEGEEVRAPDLLCAELANVYRELVLMGEIDRHGAAELMETSLVLVDGLVPVRDLAVESLNEGIRLGHSTYDMFYFVLARRLGATLVTLDRKLNALCEEQGVEHLVEIEF